MTGIRRLTAELLADLPMPSDPRMSPDGRWLAMTVTATAKRDEHRTASIWLADTTGAREARQVTAGTANDTHPRWSPDGTELAFLSDRTKRGTNQLHILALDGGEAREMTDVRGGVAGFCWVPGGGRRIAYLAIDARGEAEQKRRDDEKDDPNVYGAFWPLARIVVRDLETGQEQPIEGGDEHIWELESSPDGGRLAALVSDTPEIESLASTARLVVIDIATGERVEVARPGFGISSFAWSGDGERLYYIGAAGETPVTSSQLWVTGTRSGATPRCLSVGVPYCFSGVAQPVAGDRLLALVACGTESEIHDVDGGPGTHEILTRFSGDISRIAASDDGSVVGFLGSSPDRPDDLFVIRDGGEPRRVSNLHTDLDGIDLGSQEVLAWERAGVGLDGILIWPPGKNRTDSPLPCVVSIHGGPYGRWANEFITRFGRWIAQHGYLVFLPNPRGGAGHGQAFAESVRDTVGNEDYLDIMSGVDLIVERGIADPNRLGCGGWSQGGFMTAWIVGHTERFKAGVMGAGVSDWGMMIATSDIPTYEWHMGGGNPYDGVGPHTFDAQSPASFVSRVKTPVLIVHGENDERVPVTQGIHFFRGLRHYGVPTELVTYPREPHGIQERNHQIDLNNRIIEWFQRWIPTG